MKNCSTSSPPAIPPRDAHQETDRFPCRPASPVVSVSRKSHFVDRSASSGALERAGAALRGRFVHREHRARCLREPLLHAQMFTVMVLDRSRPRASAASCSAPSGSVPSRSAPAPSPQRTCQTQLHALAPASAPPAMRTYSSYVVPQPAVEVSNHVVPSRAQPLQGSRAPLPWSSRFFAGRADTRRTSVLAWASAESVRACVP